MMPPSGGMNRALVTSTDTINLMDLQGLKVRFKELVSLLFKWLIVVLYVPFERF